MEKLTLCRICLVKNVLMHVVADSHLQEIFEKLNNIPHAQLITQIPINNLLFIKFITEDSRPMLACFFCYARLKQCYKFRQKCLEAEAVFMQMLDEKYEEKPIQTELEFFGGFHKTPIEQFSTEDRQQQDEREDTDNIKEELTGDCDRINDVQIKVERLSDALEQDTKDDSYPGFEDNPHTQSDNEDDIPLTRIRTGVKQVIKKRKATKKEKGAREESGAVAKKLKLDVRKEKLEDTITTNDKKNEQANSKVIDRIKSSEFKPVSKITDPIKRHTFTKPVVKKCIIKTNRENAAIFSHVSNNVKNDLNYNYRSIDSDVIKKHGLYHSKSKEKPHKCDICQSTFNLKINLLTHIRTHTGEKPYKCDICQTSFTDQANLKRHIRVHTGEKPYKCDVCQTSFTRKTHLKAHIRIHSGEKPYKCDACQRSFNHKISLNIHILNHTGDKPYKCDICQSSFTLKSRLKRHIRIHDGEKPYKCDVCQRSFNRKISLKIHILNHTSDKPYKCDICQSSFIVKSRLKRHIHIHAR